MSSVLDKLRKFNDSRPQTGDFSKTKGGFKNWNDGPNIVRLIGEFVETRTHFIAPVPKRKDRGLCASTAFERDAKEKLPQIVNCLDWNVETETENKVKICPLCALAKLAKQALKENPTEEEKKYFEALANTARYRTNLRWDIFDRDEPEIIMIDASGKETSAKGIKIASIGMEAWADINGIFKQCDFDITDPDEGVDINIIKGSNGTRVEYSAQVVLSGKGLKVTPFDDEERELVKNKHDLKAVCGKMTDRKLIMDALHGDYRELLDINSEDEGVTEEETAPAPVAPSRPKPKQVITAPAEEEDDEDAITVPKKKMRQ